MTGHGDDKRIDGGGPARLAPIPPHAPVLLDEVLAALALTDGARVLDGTFGAGGYTRRILDAARDVRVIALDRDPTAIAGGADLVGATGGRLTLVESAFGELDQVAANHAFAPLDAIVLDIGVSSMQLDQAERGFSFRFDGPLDMRMARSGESAADLVNALGEEALADIIYHYGEERRSRAVARAIIEARRTASIGTTRQLAEIVSRVVRAEPGGIHPATRTFQALRIAVNDELGELVRALEAAERALKPGGRLVVVSFHSLEDRIVKHFLAKRSGRGAGLVSRHAPDQRSAPATFTLAQRGPVSAGEAELKANPRARSAKLRAAIRTEAPPQGPDSEITALAALPERRPARHSPHQNSSSRSRR
jgi:16S rRNA (cytosine1402-N4)-methyltransferase